MRWQLPSFAFLPAFRQVNHPHAKWHFFSSILFSALYSAAIIEPIFSYSSFSDSLAYRMHGPRFRFLLYHFFLAFRAFLRIVLAAVPLTIPLHTSFGFHSLPPPMWASLYFCIQKQRQPDRRRCSILLYLPRGISQTGRTPQTAKIPERTPEIPQ